MDGELEQVIQKSNSKLAEYVPHEIDYLQKLEQRAGWTTWGVWLAISAVIWKLVTMSDFQVYAGSEKAQQYVALLLIVGFYLDQLVRLLRSGDLAIHDDRKRFARYAHSKSASIFNIALAALLIALAWFLRSGVPSLITLLVIIYAIAGVVAAILKIFDNAHLVIQPINSSSAIHRWARVVSYILLAVAIVVPIIAYSNRAVGLVDERLPPNIIEFTLLVLSLEFLIRLSVDLWLRESLAVRLVHYYRLWSLGVEDDREFRNNILNLFAGNDLPTAIATPLARFERRVSRLELELDQLECTFLEYEEKMNTLLSAPLEIKITLVRSCLRAGAKMKKQLVSISRRLKDVTNYRVSIIKTIERTTYGDSQLVKETIEITDPRFETVTSRLQKIQERFNDRLTSMESEVSSNLSNYYR